MAPARDPFGTLYYIEETRYKAQKALIAAKFNGIALEKKAFDPHKDPAKPEFIAKNPTGKVPFLETDMGCIFTSNAIARYIARCRADTALCGKCFDDEGQIDTWLEFCTHEVEVPLMTWVYPVLGLMEDDPKATNEAQSDVKKAIKVLEAQLQATEYLVGDFVSLADVVMVCALSEAFVRVFDPAFRRPFPKVCTWFERCCGMPQFNAVIGPVKWCDVAEQPKACVAAFTPAPRVKAQAAAPAASAVRAAPAAAAAAPSHKAEGKGPSGKADLGKPPPKAAEAPEASPAVPIDLEAQIKAVGDEIRALKERLKAEGLSGKKINDHEEVKTLVVKLQQLKEQPAAAPHVPERAATAEVPAASAPAAAGPPDAAAPDTASGEDIEAQVKSVGDDIRLLKEKLKGEGLSGKKINDHSDVKALVEKLQELKKKLPS